MSGFNVNCKDCVHHGLKKCDIDNKMHHYCFYPRFESFIEDIEQNIDCNFYEDLKNGN